jgi:phosphoglycerate dehydrogenase-like enzyme
VSTSVSVLALTSLTPAERAQIEAVSPRIRLVEAGGWFDGEIRATWPRESTDRFQLGDSTGQATRAERDALLAETEVALIAFPFPIDLRARAPKLKWVHQRPAGASNLKAGDLWGSDITVTTSRGFAASLPIAEYVIAGFLHFARGLHRATVDERTGAFDRVSYKPLQLAGKTVCIVGAGGIGRETGRLAAALGMRVTGTRRSAGMSDALPEGFAELRGPEALHELLGSADFVAICCQWTPETEGLIDARAFAAMKPGAVLVNVARGEIVDEAALLGALAADRLRGVALDVYAGEFDGPPNPDLWHDPRVMITPHLSGRADVANRTRAIEIFCSNLTAYLAGRPLENVIDWQRGY